MNATQAKNPKPLRALLDLVARFPLESEENHLLLLTQCPQARLIAPYPQWQAERISLSRGVHGIKLLAFTGLRGAHDPTAQDEMLVPTYTIHTVFDISQVAVPYRKKAAELLPARMRSTPTALAPLVRTVLAAHPPDALAERPVAEQEFLPALAELTTQTLRAAQQQLGTGSEVQPCHVEAVNSIVSAYYGFRTPLTSENLSGWGCEAQELYIANEAVRRAAVHILRSLEQEHRLAHAAEEH